MKAKFVGTAAIALIAAGLAWEAGAASWLGKPNLDYFRSAPVVADPAAASSSPSGIGPCFAIGVLRGAASVGLQRQQPSRARIAREPELSASRIERLAAAPTDPANEQICPFVVKNGKLIGVWFNKHGRPYRETTVSAAEAFDPPAGAPTPTKIKISIGYQRGGILAQAE